MKVLPYFSNAYQSNCYVAYSNGEGIVIDPSIPYNEFLKKHGELINLNIKFIVISHAHFDHMLAIDDWIAKTGAQVLIDRDDAEMLSDAEKNAYLLFLGINKIYSGAYEYLGKFLNIGCENIQIIKIPGHTKGSVMLLSDKFAFVGDTVFAGGGVGRTDLFSADKNELIDSIKRIATILPYNTVIYSGHGPAFYSQEINNYI